jgi:hypothetical protein
MSLTTEQRAIVQAKVDAHNAANPADQLTVESLLDGIAMRQVLTWQDEAITAKGIALVSAAKAYLSETDRVAFTAEVEGLLHAKISAE